jgi:hypothetical protein
MQIIIDRFEGDYAVVELESLKTVQMPICLLPNGAVEGDVIIIEIDKDETKKRLANIKKLEQTLWED